MNDVYRGINAKNCCRDERGQSETRVDLQSLEQKMLSNKEWLAFFFHDIKNKQHLFSLFETYLCANDFIQPSSLPILVNNKMKHSKIQKKKRKKESKKKYFENRL